MTDNQAQKKEWTVADLKRAISILAIVLAGFVVGFGATIGVVATSSTRRSHEDAQKVVDANYLGCLRYNDTRLLFRDIINISFGNATATSSFDLKDIPSFNAIQDPSVKSLLLTLTTPQSGGGNTNDRRDAALARTGTRDCDKEYPDRTPGITLGAVPTTSTATTISVP